MINVKIGKRLAEDWDGKEKEKKFLIVNDIEDDQSFFDERNNNYAHFYKNEIIKIFKSHSFFEVGKLFNRVGFGVEQDWWDDWIDIEVYCKEYFNYSIPSIQVNLQIQDWENWAKPWSILNVANQLKAIIDEDNDSSVKYWQEDEDSVLNGFGVEYYPQNIENVIGEELDIILSKLNDIVGLMLKNLQESVNSDSLLTYFKFSDDTKSASMQYLIYFTQFMADLGVQIDTELKEDLDHTIFKIIPKNKDEGLEKIRDALNIYLRAPQEKNFPVAISQQNDIAAKQWEANIYHLKSQLTLAQSIIQSKDATIETLQLSNYQYSELIAKQIPKKDEDSEDLVKNIISVKKYEGKGFSVNLPELFRKLKRKLTK